LSFDSEVAFTQTIMRSRDFSLLTSCPYQNNLSRGQNLPAVCRVVGAYAAESCRGCREGHAMACGSLEAELKTSHGFGEYVTAFFTVGRWLEQSDRDRDGAFPARAQDRLAPDFGASSSQRPAFRLMGRPILPAGKDHPVPGHSHWLDGHHRFDNRRLSVPIPHDFINLLRD
jgi:hypothetical protein